MGRRESAVVVKTRQSQALALWLREQRQRAGLTYTAMASTTSYSASMLSRAASGCGVPSWRIVEEFAKACNADVVVAKHYWKKARWADEKRKRARGGDLANAVRDLYSDQLVRPELIESFDQLRRAMVELRAKYGQPSEAELQRLAGLTGEGDHRLPRSSLGAILRGELLPRCGHVTAFTEALGMPPRMVGKWEEAWQRASERARPSKLPQSSAVRPAGPPGDTASAPLSPVRIRINIPAPLGSNGPEPGGGASASPPGSGTPWGLLPQDVSYLRTHGMPVDVKRGSPVPPGPREPYPSAGVTEAGLPIRIPRRYDFFRPQWPREQAQLNSVRHRPHSWNLGVFSTQAPMRGFLLDG